MVRKGEFPVMTFIWCFWIMCQSESLEQENNKGLRMEPWGPAFVLI